MNRTQIIWLIAKVARLPDAFDQLELALAGLTAAQLSQQLLECGIIPEVFAHDSSEEKLWAKYCDILLAKCLNHIGIDTKVLRTRGDSADVFGQTTDYTIVGDAKAFRLSRTAKNQKDFKVSALDSWRRTNTFACLIAPLYQYPKRSSQIYAQAEQKNVTLLSYVHLKLIIDYLPQDSLYRLWECPGALIPSNFADLYWQHIESVLLDLTGVAAQDLENLKTLEITRTREIGMEGIAHWQSMIQSYQSLSQQEAVSRLIKAEKIEEKIRTIKQTIAWELLL